MRGRGLRRRPPPSYAAPPHSLVLDDTGKKRIKASFLLRPFRLSVLQEKGRSERERERDEDLLTQSAIHNVKGFL